MERFTRIRPCKLVSGCGSAAALWLIVAMAQAQTLPASAPTHPAPSPPVQTAMPAPPVVPTTPARKPADRARVEMVNGQLTVTAENSSLDQILNDIARLNGMKITGGVIDERVFGSYGPASQQEVIAQLLDGTGSNVLILQTADSGVSELQLSPRNGGPTPPSPNSSWSEERDGNDRPQEPDRRRGMRPDFPGRMRFGNQGPPEGAQPPAAPPNPEAGTTTEQSPNGVKTPQQIYDDLVKAQQQAAPNPQ
jgi:hypothetical protein